MQDTNTVSFFRKLVLLSIILIYLVILAGGIVRSTGSGMGCPDWPKCFGRWVPPTEVSQLPADYKEVFKVGNRYIADFNPFKTWVEYINRLLGVLVGFSVFATFLYSLRFRGRYNNLIIISLIIVLLTGFQGWVGAKVVSTFLSKYLITIHMLIALVIMSLALYLYRISGNGMNSHPFSSINGKGLLILITLTLGQILLGTQVRQEVDGVSARFMEMRRDLWVGEIGQVLSVHRMMAISIVLLNAVFGWWIIKKVGTSSTLFRLWTFVMLIFGLEYLAGIALVQFEIPAFLQPVHLVLASMVFGLQFYSWLITSQSSALKEVTHREISI